MWISTVLNAALCLAQIQAGNPAPPVETSNKTITVSGIVQDSATGQPIRCAFVTLHEFAEGGQEQRQTVSGEDGRFQFRAVRSGGGTIRADRLGYSQRQIDIQATLTSDWTDCVIKMDPLAAISGQVTDAHGEPLSGVAVQAIRLTTVRGFRKMAVEAWNNTNDLGEFRLWHLRPGRYLLKALGRRQVLFYMGERGLMQTRESYGPVYYPDDDSATSANIVLLKPGEELAAHFSLKPHAAFRISGRILGAVREQALNATLSRSGGEEVAARTAINVENGSFSVDDVPPGDYTISMTEPVSQSPKSAITEVHVRDRNVEGVTLELLSSPEVTFELDGTTGSGPRTQFASMELHRADSKSPNPEQRLFFRPGTASSKLTLAPGRYLVAINAFGGYVESVTSGETDVLVSGLAVSSGVTPAPVKVKLSSGGGMILFKSAGGDGPGNRDVPSAPALIVGPVDGPWIPVEVERGGRQDGIGIQVAPGEYFVVRLTDPEAEYRDKSKIAGDIAKAKRIKVVEGQNVEVQLEAEEGKP